jgi:sugar O-acyltransferase (sialic acid O-acetyltransferase NeuD family)
VSDGTVPVVVIGAGGHGRETVLLISQIAAHGGSWRVIGFLDDNKSLHGNIIAGLPVLGGLELLQELTQETSVALGMGSPAAKRSILSRLPHTSRLASLVHPSVLIGDRVRIDCGTQIHAGTIITCDVVIGSAVTINRHCDISHDVVLGDYCTLAPSVSLAGNVQIDHDTDVGLGARIIPGVRVGARSVIGAGAVVVSDLPASCVAIGVPARVARLINDAQTEIR